MCLLTPGASVEKGQQKLDRLQRTVVKMIEGLEIIPTRKDKGDRSGTT